MDNITYAKYFFVLFVISLFFLSSYRMGPLFIDDKKYFNINNIEEYIGDK